MKKIVHIVEAFGGGVFSYMVDLTNYLSDEFDITIAYSLRPQTPSDFKSYFNSNVKLIEVKSFSRSLNIRNDIKACFEIIDLVDKINPDIIHLHSSKAGILGRLAFSSRKRKIFYTPHGYAFLKKDDSKLKRLFYKTLEAIAAKKSSSVIIACSRGEYLESLKLTKSSMYISNGIKISSLQANYTPSVIELNKNKIEVCIIGRICSQKNPEMFNAIASLLPEVNFLWIGDGELRHLLTSSNITVTGWLSREVVIENLIKSNFFILPSLWEGLPISLLEAMYFKKICLVSNIPGNNDVIIHEENGFVCDTAEDYVFCIKKVLDGQVDILKLTNNAHDDVLNKYNTSTSSKKYANLYNN
jgi:glycosyltransferase involved in cell wall biosynthesis